MCRLALSAPVNARWSVRPAAGAVRPLDTRLLASARQADRGVATRDICVAVLPTTPRRPSRGSDEAAPWAARGARPSRRAPAPSADGRPTTGRPAVLGRSAAPADYWRLADLLDDMAHVGRTSPGRVRDLAARRHNVAISQRRRPSQPEVTNLVSPSAPPAVRLARRQFQWFGRRRRQHRQWPTSTCWPSRASRKPFDLFGTARRRLWPRRVACAHLRRRRGARPSLNSILDGPATPRRALRPSDAGVVARRRDDGADSCPARAPLAPAQSPVRRRRRSAPGRSARRSVTPAIL